MEPYIHLFGVSFVLGILVNLIFKQRPKTRSVCVVVLGDIGRSPRMQYHAKSFLLAGFDVEVVGYSGSAPLRELTDSPDCRIYHLASPPDFKSRLPTIIAYLLKVLWQSLNLLYVLLIRCRSSYLLLQNPPAVPAIPVCWFYCLCSKSELAIDWHNYGFSIMALGLGERHSMVYFATRVETFFGAMAAHSFCVTRAMQADLKQKWNIKAKVLYDRPAEEFHPLSATEKHNFLLQFGDEFLKSDPNYPFDLPAQDGSIFTRRTDSGEILDLENRPAILVSSTSWTEDEDFSILLDALDGYEKECETSDSADFPNLICAITGKGPLKEFYSAIIQRRKWKRVFVITPWLKNEDYPKLLACADLGVCLHTSSSGLDLPMKVVDMFGCGLPVCAYNFKCLNELVKHNENGLVFSDSSELTEQLKSWFRRSPGDDVQRQKCAKFKDELIKFQQLRWHANWTNEVLPCFEC